MLNKIKKLNKENGATLIESLVALFIISIFIVIFGSSYFIIVSSQYIKHRTLAIKLAEEEIEALRQLSFSEIENVDNVDFIDVAYNKGAWIVNHNITPPSGSNYLELQSPSGNPMGITGTAILPNFEYSNFEIESKFRIDSSSPSAWQVGIFTRYHDLKNYYLLYFNSSNIFLQKSEGGIVSTISSKSKSFNTNNWYTLKISQIDDDINVYIDGILEITAADNPSSFQKGRLALYGGNSVNAQFDDAIITAGTVVDSWNFDADEIGKFPAEWKRYGINDLPSGSSKLTITNSESGYEDIKNIVARVEWQERNNLRSIEVITLITE